MAVVVLLLPLSLVPVPLLPLPSTLLVLLSVLTKTVMARNVYGRTAVRASCPWPRETTVVEASHAVLGRPMPPTPPLTPPPLPLVAVV